MSIKPDKWIRRMALDHGMITPFSEATSGNGIISYGVTSYGYDIRLAPEYTRFSWDGGKVNIIDPKNFNPAIATEYTANDGGYILLHPHEFILARSVEYFKIPRNVACNVTSKSTYARCGAVLLCTPLEPEWEGTITLEIANNTNLWIKLYTGEGIGQVQFFESDQECETSYADKKGKYQHQIGVTLPKVL